MVWAIRLSLQRTLGEMWIWSVMVHAPLMHVLSGAGMMHTKGSSWCCFSRSSHAGCTSLHVFLSIPKDIRKSWDLLLLIFLALLKLAVHSHSTSKFCRGTFPRTAFSSPLYIHIWGQSTTEWTLPALWILSKKLNTWGGVLHFHFGC